MAIFKQKTQGLPAEAPEGDESPNEAAVMETLNKKDAISMSQTQINDIIIENNNMLKEIIIYYRQ